MVQQNALLRIFWPSDIISSNISGILVGWRNSPSDLLVISVLEDVGIRTVESALEAGVFFRNSQFPIERLLERCGRLKLQILGLVNPQSHERSQSKGLLIAHVAPGQQVPRIDKVDVDSSDIQLIIFKRPQPVKMQFMSLDPISLALSQNFQKMAIQGLPPDEVEATEAIETQRVQDLARKLEQHTVTRFTLTWKELVLPIVLNQINCSFEIAKLVQKNAHLVKTVSKRRLSISERVVESASTIKDKTLRISELILFDTLYQLAMQSFIFLLITLRVGAEMVLIIVGWRFKSGDLALKDISATAQQLDLRLQQFSYWPIQSMTLRERRNDWRSITDHHTQYIRFFNSIWLVANDVILGMAIGSFLVQNADIIAESVKVLVETWSTSGLHQSISWLTTNPGGLKLNNELASFLAVLSQWVIDFWAGKSKCSAVEFGYAANPEQVACALCSQAFLTSFASLASPALVVRQCL